MSQCSQSCARAASNIALPPETRSSSRSWPARPVTRIDLTDVLLAGEGSDLKSTARPDRRRRDHRPGEGRQGHGVQEAPPPQLPPQGGPPPAAHDPEDRLDRRQEGREEGRRSRRPKLLRPKRRRLLHLRRPSQGRREGRKPAGEEGRRAEGRKPAKAPSTKDAAPAKAAAKKASKRPKPRSKFRRWHIRKQAAPRRNGRDSRKQAPRREEVRRPSGARRQHHRASARHASGTRATTSAWARTIPFLRLPTAASRFRDGKLGRKYVHIDADYAGGERNRGPVDKGPLPGGGSPDEIQTRIDKGRRGKPPLLPFCFEPIFSRNCHGAALAAPLGRRRDDVRADRTTAAEARLGRGRAGAGRSDRRRDDRPQPRDRAMAVWPARCRGLPRRSRAIRSCRRFLIFERTDGAPRLVGSCGLGRRPSGAVELGYWIARAHWGRGYRDRSRPRADRHRPGARLARGSKASHFLDNPASGRVLEKLGFEPLGITAPRMSCARGAESAGDGCFACSWRMRTGAGGGGAGSLGRVADLLARGGRRSRGGARLVVARAAGGRPRSTGGSRAGRT